MARKRVVVLGAGFGGLECAKKLDSSAVDVLLVDRHNYHLFTPLLYQVASSLLNASDIAFPIRKVFRSSPNVRFDHAEIQSIELEDKELVTQAGERISYDYIVVAAGSTTNFFGNEAIERRALGLKTLGEALQLRNHILECLETASRLETVEEQAPWMTFMVVGGGPTGVEYAGALAELMRLVVEREYPQIRVEPRILLVEGCDQLLGAFSDKLGDYTRRRLEALGVETVLSTLVTSADERVVRLSDGAEVVCHTLVWSAGVKPAAITESMRVDLTDRSHRIAVDGYLRMAGRNDAFAIGDVAGVIQDDGELPMLSAPAMQQGRYVADHILANLGRPADEPPTGATYRYVDKGTMATIGRHAGLCAVGKLELTGWLGWLGWLVVHIYYLIGFRNRLVVLWSWAWNYVWYDRPVRIIARARRPLPNPAALEPNRPDADATTGSC